MKIRDVDRRVLVAGAAVAVLVVALVVVLALTRSGGADTSAREPVTVTYQQAAPTPDAAPVERDTGTDLLAGLPGTVLGWAVSGQEESSALLDHAALEGWRLTYSGADGDVVLQVGQWPEDEEAGAVLDALVGESDGEEVSREEVQVEGEPVGEVVVLATDDGERAIWRNGTTVLVLDGPEGVVGAFYEAFPL